MTLPGLPALPLVFDDYPHVPVERRQKPHEALD